MSRTCLALSDTAVSQSIGFILITTILTISVIVIFAVGYPVYNSYVDNGHLSNMQASFDIMAYNGNNVALHNNPFSTSEVKIYGGTLATRESGYLNISYYTSTSGPILMGNNPLTMLEYTKGQDRIAYIDGSVCRSTGNITYMLNDPKIYGDDDTFVITHISLYDSVVSLGGNSITRIYFFTPYYSKMLQTVTYPPAVMKRDVRRIEINISGDYKDSFGRYFSDTCGFALTPNPDGSIMASKAFPAGTDLYFTQAYLMVEAG